MNHLPNQAPRQITAKAFIAIIIQADKEQYAEFYEPNEEFGEIIVIRNVEISEDVELNEHIIVDSVLIIENTKFDTFRIAGGIFRNEFRITDATFKNSFWVHGGIFQSDFWIDGGIFQNGLIIDGGIFKNYFNVYGGTFNNDFRIDGGVFENTFGIYGGKFESNLLIYDGKFQTEFKIGGGIFQKELLITGGFLNSILIGNLESKMSLLIRDDSFINYLEVTGTIPKESLLRISGKVYALNFVDVQNFGTIVLNQLSSRQKLYTPEENLLQSVPSDIDTDMPTQTELHIENSDLGKTTLINCDLSSFGLNFKSSKITEVFVTGTLMPQRITNVDPIQQQLGYSQIKKIYEARGDRVEANRYFAQEMEAYLTTLSWRNWSDFWEKLNLGLNKYSTYYGQSWQRGLLSTLIISGTFYALYCYSLGYRISMPSETTIDEFWNLSSYFLEFLNPIHKADYVAEKLNERKTIDYSWGQNHLEVGGWSRTLEGISRIFIAYFVYQFIQAFRKHGKASG
jgi:hypothetical protein